MLNCYGLYSIKCITTELSSIDLEFHNFLPLLHVLQEFFIMRMYRFSARKYAPHLQIEQSVMCIYREQIAYCDEANGGPYSL